MSQEENFPVIAIMKQGGGYFDKWKSLRDHFKDTLNNGAVMQKIAYTPHDYDKHCVNIYNIISSILLKEYELASNRINIENFFVLNIAVLLHDLYMAYNPDLRDVHSEKARDFVINETLKYNIRLDNTQALCIGDVIYGHSDIKRNGETIVKTIEKLPGKEDSPVGQMADIINVKFLSALLRLADELDENDRRIGNENPDNYEMNKGSREHWRKCELFLFPSLKRADKRVIVLNSNNSRIRNDGITKSDCKLMVGVRDKIQSELNYLNDNVFFSSDCPIPWTFTRLEIKADQEILDKINKIEKDKIDETLSENPIVSAEPVKVEIREIKIEDVEFRDRLNSIVVSRRLLKSGHFLIDENTCARDWIDTKSLLSDRVLANDICNRFRRYIGEREYNIIGIGHSGIILSSVLGLLTSNPFNFISPHKHQAYNTEFENLVHFEVDKKFILLTDVVVTGNTVSRVLKELEDKYNIKYDSIDHICSIFVRNSIFEGDMFAIPFAEKLFALSDNLGIEICKKPACQKCVFRAYGIDLYENKPYDLHKE